MKLSKLIKVLLAVGVALPLVADAYQGGRNYQIHNRLRLEYDDNITEADRDKLDSFKVINEIEFLVNFNLENTFVSFRYKPSFVWWDDREGDSTDLHHEFDFIFNHTFTPRTALSIKDTFRYSELPESIDRGTVVREKSDFLYNALLGTLTYQITPVGRIEASGRYNLLRYDLSEVAVVEDYDMYIAGLTYRHNLVPETSLLTDFRFETIEYDEVDRGSDSYQLGVGVEHMFSPNMLGNTRVGYMTKEYNDSSLSSDKAPYVDLNLTALPSPATRITLGIGYSMLEADIFPYANQERFRIYTGISHDITARIALHFAGSYARSKYDAADAIPAELERFGVTRDDLADGTEEVMQISARATYRVNRSNWLEAGWQFTTLDSDLRQDYDRNRISLGWKTQL